MSSIMLYFKVLLAQLDFFVKFLRHLIQMLFVCNSAQVGIVVIVQSKMTPAEPVYILQSSTDLPVESSRFEVTAGILEARS